MPRLTSVIDQLPARDQERIIAWLETESLRKVVDRIAEPPPAGFGLPTHVTTLRRFYARHQAASENRELARECSAQADNPLFHDGAEALLNKWAFSLASNPCKSIDAFKALNSWLQRTRELRVRETALDLHRQRLLLDQDKFHFNAARAALRHHDELARILRAPDLDDEARINAARKCLFGDDVPLDPPISNDPHPQGGAS